MKLYTETTNDLDLSGWIFAVEAGEQFDIDYYCEVFNINIYDFDPQEIKAAQDAADRLMPGSYLLVSHENS